MDPRNTVSLVTGAATGIGAAIAGSLLQAGALVALNDLDPEAVEATRRGLDAKGTRTIALEGDVSTEADVNRMVSKIVGHWGRLDVLVNNAGVLTQAPVMEVATSDWDRVMAVNARGTLLCTQAAGREMVTRRRGCIVNIASIAAREATPGLAAYAASKFAVLALTQVTAKELASFGVRCNAVCPGFVGTAMLDQLAQDWSTTRDEMARDASLLGRLQSMDDIADTVLFLIQTESITGQAINVCGGTRFS